MSMAAMVAENDVFWLQAADYADCIRLLAQVGVRGAVKNAPWEVIQDGLFKAAYLVEAAEKREVIDHGRHHYTSQQERGLFFYFRMRQYFTGTRRRK